MLYRFSSVTCTLYAAYTARSEQTQDTTTRSKIITVECESRNQMKIIYKEKKRRNQVNFLRPSVAERGVSFNDTTHYYIRFLSSDLFLDDFQDYIVNIRYASTLYTHTEHLCVMCVHTEPMRAIRTRNFSCSLSTRAFWFGPTQTAFSRCVQSQIDRKSISGWKRMMKGVLQVNLLTYKECIKRIAVCTATTIDRVES